MPAPPGSSRGAPPDVAELRALAERQPELAGAAAMQIELIEAQRRVRSRLSTPALDRSPAELADRLAAGRPLVDAATIAFDWNDVRLLVRQATDALRRFDAIDASQAAALQALGRDPSLPDTVREWMDGRPAEGIEMLDEVLTCAVAPYLQRLADVLRQKVSFDAWRRPICPVCGAAPDFSVVTQAGDRLLCCGRCHARWPFDPIACPYCANADRARITSLATPDGMYRVMVCQACERYIKAIDLRHAPRPLLPGADPILTLPLDAAVLRQGAKA